MSSVNLSNLAFKNWSNIQAGNQVISNSDNWWSKTYFYEKDGNLYYQNLSIIGQKVRKYLSCFGFYSHLRKENLTSYLIQQKMLKEGTVLSSGEFRKEIAKIFSSLITTPHEKPGPTASRIEPKNRYKVEFIFTVGNALLFKEMGVIKDKGLAVSDTNVHDLVRCYVREIGCANATALKEKLGPMGINVDPNETKKEGRSLGEWARVAWLSQNQTLRQRANGHNFKLSELTVSPQGKIECWKEDDCYEFQVHEGVLPILVKFTKEFRPVWKILQDDIVLHQSSAPAPSPVYQKYPLLTPDAKMVQFSSNDLTLKGFIFGEKCTVVPQSICDIIKEYSMSSEARIVGGINPPLDIQHLEDKAGVTTVNFISNCPHIVIIDRPTSSLYLILRHSNGENPGIRRLPLKGGILPPPPLDMENAGEIQAAINSFDLNQITVAGAGTNDYKTDFLIMAHQDGYRAKSK